MVALSVRYIRAGKFKHSFDLGEFRLLKDNNDGTALFYKIASPFESPSYVTPEGRAVRYSWTEMRL